MARTVAISNVEKKYKVRKGEKVFYVEVARTRDGRPIVSVFKTTKNVVVFKDEKGKRNEKIDWEHELSDFEEVDYEKLPMDIRRALSKLLV